MFACCQLQVLMFHGVTEAFDASLFATFASDRKGCKAPSIAQKAERFTDVVMALKALFFLKYQTLDESG